MRAWPTSDVPQLEGFGSAPDVSVFDTATGGVEPTTPEGPARMYVCGITPYDATHIGHAATYVAFDLLNRAWRDAGHDVTYVQNVTDVDDPLLERATATGTDWQELAERETELFREDMTALRVLPPDEYVGAVESIPLVLEVIQQLRDKGFVYEVEGDLYFAVHSDPRVGKVSGLTEQEMLDVCSAIALRFLGESFDVQGGGSDLAFPHHEMSASEAQAAFDGLTFARAYMHAGMVAYQGEKMSKSKGNLVFVSKLRESGTDPMAIRLALLAHHYRSDWEWTGAELERAEARLASWRSALEHASDQQAHQLVGVVRSCLADDLDAPAALGAVDAWAAGRRGDGTGADVVRRLLDARLGILL
jgi:L-cysteine:1D-myo-inositol 2-amino-2-deoxy-alpha-D-glucopyranoside ligase